MILYPEAVTTVGYESPSILMMNNHVSSAVGCNTQPGNFLSAQSNQAVAECVVGSKSVHAGPFAGAGLSNYYMGGLFNYQFAANVAISQAQMAQYRLNRLAGIDYGPYFRGTGWDMTQATNAGNAGAHAANSGIANSGPKRRALPKHHPYDQRHTQSLFQASARHRKQSQSKDQPHSHTQKDFEAGVQTRSQRRAQAQAQAREQSNAAASRNSKALTMIRDDDDREKLSNQIPTQQEDNWMELWDNTRWQLNELGKEYRDERDSYLKEEIQQDMAKLRKRKAHFEQLLGFEPS